MTERLKADEASITLPIRMPISIYRALKSMSSRELSCGAIVRQAITEYLAARAEEHRYE